MKNIILLLFTLIFLNGTLLSQDAAVLHETSQDFTGVAKKAIPAVVSVQVKSKANATSIFNSDSLDEFLQDDFFGRFFGIPRKDRESSQYQTALGSGFIVSPDGYILTNGHVVKDYVSILVKLNDGREFDGKVIGEDDSTDVALIKIEAKDLPYIDLGNSDQLQVGQWVVAIGNPFGLQASLTAGVVSAKGRTNLDITRIEDFIQTDAAINTGNSGGPLLNLKGDVIGINTAMATNISRGYVGVGFAIPSNIAKHVMEQLIATGHISRGYIGIMMQDIDIDLAQSFGLKKSEGALVVDVVKDSPAEKAGLKQGDIIIKINNQAIENYSLLRNMIALQPPGTKVNLEIIRDKQPKTVSLEIGTLSEKNILAESNINNSTNPYGIEVQALTTEVARKYGVSDSAGVIVTKVDPSSTAAYLGIKKGIVILSVNQQKISTKQEFDKILREAPKDKPVVFLLKAGDLMRYISIRLE